LTDDKAGGADELAPRYLNKIKDEISYPLIEPLAAAAVSRQKPPQTS